MTRKIRLEGITLKGKNKVREHGELWEVLEIRNNVSCLGGGTGYLLKSVRGDNRWVKVSNDEDFKVQLISEK